MRLTRVLEWQKVGGKVGGTGRHCFSVDHLRGSRPLHSDLRREDTDRCKLSLRPREGRTERRGRRGGIRVHKEVRVAGEVDELIGRRDDREVAGSSPWR